MLLIYLKDTGEVVYYAEKNGCVNPTLLGVFHACLKKNYPHLCLDDFGEHILDDRAVDEDGILLRQKVFSHKVLVDEHQGKLIFTEKPLSDQPPIEQSSSQDQRIADLEMAIATILGGGV